FSFDFFTPFRRYYPPIRKMNTLLYMFYTTVAIVVALPQQDVSKLHTLARDLEVRGEAKAAPVRGRGLLQTTRGERNHSQPFSEATLLMEEVVSMATGTASIPVWLMVFGLGFAAASFALYTWLSSNTKGTAEQLVVDRKSEEAPMPEVFGEALQQGEAAMQDFESLAKTLAQSVAQRIGPKLAKGQAVRGILESRLYQFPDKAKTFVLNELNSTAGAVMRAIEAEEAMILLDLDKALSSNFPPISMLLAGLISPTLLNISMSALRMQNTLVVLPVLLLCGWAMWQDYGAACSIPTMTMWVKAQVMMALVLGVSNGMVAWKISQGKTALDVKTERLQRRIKEAQASGNPGVGQLRELFVCNSVLIQEALLLEDEVKASIWFNASGVASVLWLGMTLWTWVLVFGWTFVPGITAFDQAAQHNANYCGAWATVLAARITAILAVLFLVVNILTVCNWLATVFITSDAFAQSMLKKACEIDRQALGFPVAQLLVKAMLLRGRSETLGAKLSLAESAKADLEKEKLDLQSQLNSLETQISARVAEVEAIRARVAEAAAKGASDPMGFEAGARALETADVEELAASWKEHGQKAVEDAQARAAAVKQQTTEELDRLVQRFMELVQQVQDSEAYQSTALNLQSAAEQGMASASQAMAQATAAAEGLQERAASTNVRSLVEQGAASASEAAAQAMRRDS
ncbi:unnamed protein product, partial [Symbiodinium sp. CCMP2456]